MAKLEFVDIPGFNKSKLAWKNNTNKNFYAFMEAGKLEEFANMAGLANGCDLQLLNTYWQNAESILDVGAGYGRSLDYLKNKNFNGKIVAIERCNTLFKHMKNKYESYNNINLLHNDIKYIKDIEREFDLIMLLWSSLAEFCPEEQLKVIRKLKNFLRKNGKIVIDTIPENFVPTLAHKHKEQIYITTINKKSVYTYEPTTFEIHQYAKMAGFEKIVKVCYQTDNQRQRWLYIMS